MTPALLVALFYGVKHWYLPYGYRPCTYTCIYVALQMYAADYAGRYPDGRPTALESLQLLYPKYANAPALAGLSGSLEKTRNRLESGGKLDETVSGWVYIPGLQNSDRYNRHTDGPAICWDRRPGIASNGMRTQRGSHTVLFAAHPQRQIPSAEWESFLKQEEEYREFLFARHGRPSATNAPQAKP